MKKQILTATMALLGIAAMAQEKVRVHNGDETYVTTIEQITFDVTDADQAISVTDLATANDSLSTANATLTGEKNALKAGTASLKADTTTLNGQIKTLTGEKNALKADTASLKAEKQALESQIGGLNSQVDGLKADTTTLNGQIKTLTGEKNALKADTASLKAEKQALESQIGGLNSQVDGLKADTTTLNGQIKTLTGEKNALKTDTTSLKAEIQALNGKIKMLTGPANGHDYVDFGLPSGLLWAICNVGASAPEEYGDYIAWGETEGYNTSKKNFDCSTYKLCNGNSLTMTKYCISNSYGTVDNKTQLELADDAARANWGGNWRMPTQSEWDELYDNTTQVWTDDYNGTGVSGCVLISTKKGYEGATIFLPAAGYRHYGNFDGGGTNGCYWSSSLYEDYSNSARYLFFNSRNFNPRKYDYRFYGLSVRPVCPSAE